MSEYGSNASITGSLIVDGEIDLGSGDDDIVMDGDDNTLVVDGQNNRVGILTDSPDYALDVAGDIGVDQYIYHNDDADTWIKFGGNAITLKAGNLSFINLDKKASAPHEFTINDGSNNIDFIVKGNGSNGGNPLFKCDASTGRVGINGIGSPTEELHVEGNFKLEGDDPRIKIDADLDSHPGLEFYERGTRKWIIYNDYTNDNLTFKTNSDIRMAITDEGEVGIGTTDPDEDAILELSSSDQGFMLPRVLSNNKPTAASALNGLMLYEEDTHRLKIVANGEWQTISFED